MAALRGTVIGARGVASRLAHKSITTASTWHTTVAVDIDAEGYAVVMIDRDGDRLLTVIVEPESHTDKNTAVTVRFPMTNPPARKES
jgi:hypothetical protein